MLGTANCPEVRGPNQIIAKRNEEKRRPLDGRQFSDHSQGTIWLPVCLKLSQLVKQSEVQVKKKFKTENQERWWNVKIFGVIFVLPCVARMARLWPELLKADRCYLLASVRSISRYRL